MDYYFIWKYNWWIQFFSGHPVNVCKFIQTCKVSNLHARWMMAVCNDWNGGWMSFWRSEDNRVYRFPYEGFTERGEIPLGHLDHRGKDRNDAERSSREKGFRSTVRALSRVAVLSIFVVKSLRKQDPFETIGHAIYIKGISKHETFWKDHIRSSNYLLAFSRNHRDLPIKSFFSSYGCVICVFHYVVV